MNQTQKVIKIIAICFAAFLIFNIVAGILGGLYFFTRSAEVSKKDLQHYEEVYNYVSSILVDASFSDVTIVEGERFQVVADVAENSLSNVVNHGTLKIEEKNSWFFGEKNHGQIQIMVPSTVLSELEINMGAGKLVIDGITSHKFSLDQGAGILTIQNSNFNQADIDGGAGEMNIISSTISNLDLDAGVGKVFIDARLYGNNDIECGVGDVQIALEDANDYQIRVDKGLGSIMIDGKEQKDGAIIGNGHNLINISGGVGNIEVDFDVF